MCLGVPPSASQDAPLLKDVVSAATSRTVVDDKLEANTARDNLSPPLVSGDRQTIVVFDWDDTLLCTSFLAQWEGRQMPAVIQRQLQGIESVVRTLLEAALKLGQAFIITNASYGWVEHTTRQVMPDLLPLVEQVRVVSARDDYSAQYPEDVAKWKLLAFLELQKEFDSHRAANLICLGDSHYEMDAVQAMSKKFVKARTKTIKFQQHPTAEELLKQLKVVAPKFETIIKADKSLTIGLERKSPAAAQAA